jgi:flagellin-like hook-associated protein FlgL
MQLTNFSFLNSRMDYLDSQANFKSAVQRISSGSKMEGLRKDVGAYSQGVNARLSQLHNNSYKTNLQNTRSLLEVQEHGLRQVLDIYDRMDVLAVKALDPTSSPSDRKLYDEEFKSLSSQLEEIMKRKFNGDYLYSNTVVCGGVREIALGELDLATINDTWNHAIRSQSAQIGSPAGSLSFRINSGSAGDTYRVWLGDQLVLSLGAPPHSNSTVDHRLNYNSPAPGYDEDYEFNFERIIGGPPGSAPVPGVFNNVAVNDTGSRSGMELNINVDASLNVTAGITKEGTGYKVGDSVDVSGADVGLGPATRMRLSITEMPDPFSHLPTPPNSNPGNGWKTSSSASAEDDDLVEVTFEPGKPTTYRITPGFSNRDSSDPKKSGENSGTATGDPDTPYIYSNVYAYDLPEGFDQRDLTIQIETATIGIIYKKDASSGAREKVNDISPFDPNFKLLNTGVTFTPKEYNTEVEMNASGDSITLDAKGFGTLADASPVTGVAHTLTDYYSARDTLDHLRGNPYANDGTISYYGEEKCVVSERLASVGAEMSRIDKALEDLDRKAITDELTISRIEDADVAQEATNLATASIKIQMSAQVMSKSTRLKDILIPLATQHFRSSVLSAKL